MQTSRKKFLHLAEEDEEDCYRPQHINKQRKQGQRAHTEQVFKCRHCRSMVVPLASGGHHRNHCPDCLYSRHVDDRSTGDRLSNCGASMQPIGYFQRPKGEYVIVHQCLGCNVERFNRIAADDDFELVLSLPLVPARTSREMKWQRWLDEQQCYLVEETDITLLD